MEEGKLYFIQFGFPNTQLWELMQELFSTIDPGWVLRQNVASHNVYVT
jgi:hypothetical protein